MNNLILDKKFINSIDFFDNILLLDSFEQNKKVYNMAIDYLKKENYYLLKLNISENNNTIIDTECKLSNKLNGSIVISNLINLVTTKYNNDLIIDVKEIDKNNQCIKFGRRTYNAKK